MKHIYLMYGEDDFSKEDFEKKFIAENVDPSWESFNLDILDANDITVSKISESFNSPPFGFGNKVILVKNAEALFSKSEDELKDLDNLFINPIESNFLLLSANSIDKRKSAVKKILEHAEVKEFLTPKPWELAKKLHPWIEDQFRKQSKRIEIEALEILTDATGGNKHKLEREIEKLILYAGTNQIIKYSDVKLLVPNNESDIFEFIEFIAKKEVGNALSQLGKLLYKDVPLKIISSLYSNIKSSYSLKLLEESGMGYSDISKNSGSKPFIVEKNLKLWKKFNTKQLREMLKDLYDLDSRFKSESINAKIELEKFLIKSLLK
jgi:DNA polymerase-3 subunit delta